MLDQQDLARAYLGPVPEFPGCSSARMLFQWNCLKRYWPCDALNVGCADDPLRFGPRCTHLDLDDWSAHFDKIGAPFVQGDVQEMSELLGYQSFDLVIMGDTLEHVPMPLAAVLECGKVARKAICLTVWEELRLSTPGRHISEGQRRADEEVRKLGFADRFEHQSHLYPDRVGYSDSVMPHLIHIWRFTDELIETYVSTLELSDGWRRTVLAKVPEVVTDNIQFYNWLILLEKEDPDDTSNLAT